MTQILAASAFWGAVTLALSTWHNPTSDEILVGEATYMDRGVMETVAYNKSLIHADPDLSLAAAIAAYQDWLHGRGLRGAVALNRAGDLNRKVWIEGPLGVEGPFLSIDCAQKAHYLDRETAGRVVEVDYVTAKRWGMVDVGLVAVKVYFVDPATRRAEHPVGIAGRVWE